MAVQFVFKSLLSCQEWLIFLASFIFIAIRKKNSLWAILATIAFSFLFIR